MKSRAMLRNVYNMLRQSFPVITQDENFTIISNKLQCKTTLLINIEQ